ncbi:DUF1292 domain-containing protein [Halalkalibacterium halodurans]|jgi:uncharacterized protein YrzB (UPF0473 family)|uniref:UPF0473 protein BH1270 n=1 Tax=Halalkalibacterium halodurans (strain ATCC BAA-125 / DSM 18197 / FERM 7344 / JCM 9153 / C-125) TaxID=272558 RepID=Y1270_HALH5|nr:DUF1292 domain-containing protein [Halalkalibacterium halodurans]Q9KDE3.1 RecName: Full=UPF0473 protein BH1270 [Halalkalibacterium halodurans C-125]MDY7221796.1 DUF1292 domain-containing protein [Halalkalibacterium halodurans]MDY7241072.1 DUF1292 domain-containing protein [Halalkalibacterium halodurans]MED3648482.1 DUF1292 domain-containing protein [Halalkalibacterium halodurans]MED4081879.1 DUF1292 domain-containing protein [Halalkalibacterium halodurans]MED4086005.1 DUF1292 domain-contai
MAQEEKERIVIPDENGDEHLFDELFKFTVDETGKSYILLTPVGEEEGEEEEAEVFAFRFEDREGEENDIALFPIETDEEWDMVEEMLNTFSEE